MLIGARVAEVSADSDLVTIAWIESDLGEAIVKTEDELRCLGIVGERIRKTKAPSGSGMSLSRYYAKPHRPKWDGQRIQRIGFLVARTEESTDSGCRRRFQAHQSLYAYACLLAGSRVFLERVETVGEFRNCWNQRRCS